MQNDQRRFLEERGYRVPDDDPCPDGLWVVSVVVLGIVLLLALIDLLS
jgi:hypothetical protein